MRFVVPKDLVRACLAPVVISCVVVSSASAQTVFGHRSTPAPSGGPAAVNPADPYGLLRDVTPKEASLSRSALRATTFKVSTFFSNLAILSYGSGGIVGGMVLATAAAVESWGVYTLNDYVWDRYAPARPNEGKEFDANASFWRTSEKFLTYKPVVASFKYASIYLYTGSASIALVYGTTTILSNTVEFYANNFAWDLYDCKCG